MDDKVYNVLFLSTTNSARSLMAEALLTTAGGGRFRGFSAGSSPSGVVHPFTLEQVATTGYSIERLRSKSWDRISTFVSLPLQRLEYNAIHQEVTALGRPPAQGA